MAVNTQAVEPSFEDLDQMLTDGIAPVTAMPPAEIVDTGSTPPAEVTPPAEPTPAEPAAPAVAAEPGDAAETPTESAEPATAEHKPGWVDKRMSSLAAKRREAEQDARIARQEAADARARNEQLQRELEAARAGKPAEVPTGQPVAAKPVQAVPGAAYEKPKPSLKDFTQAGGAQYVEGQDYDEAAQRYTESLLDWREDKRAFDDAVAFTTAERTKQEQIFAKDIQSAMEAHPEFEDAKDFVISKTSDQLQTAISNLPRLADGKAIWPQVVIHLADNPDVLQSLNELYSENPYAATAQLGQIMAQLIPATPGRARAAAAVPAAAPAARRAAATPPRVVGGNAAPAPVALDDITDMNEFGREIGKYMK